jgi:hypothetical protein
MIVRWLFQVVLITNRVKLSDSTGVVPLAAVTVDGGNNPRLTLRFPYSPFVFTRSQSVRTFKAITHALQHIKTETKIGDAIREIREVAI